MIHFMLDFPQNSVGLDLLVIEAVDVSLLEI